ncbi:MAG TPA: hypothetical protein VNL97_01330 [Solirubrobacterales bacterium]|nr:hypothetical protein [Solirubrobacterales bacterium]
MLLLGGAGAHAEETSPTRAEYVAQVEPICQANTEANERILKNAKYRAQHGKMKQAARQFIHASAAFGATVEKISAVPRPPADEPRLLKWFKFLKIVTTNLHEVGTALREEDKIRAAHEGIRVQRSSNAANNVGFVFGFHYCRIAPSRFT